MTIHQQYLRTKTEPEAHVSWPTQKNNNKIIKNKKYLTCDSFSFCTIVSFPTLILRVDNVSLSSSASHPINLATVNRPEKYKLPMFTQITINFHLIFFSRKNGCDD